MGERIQAPTTKRTRFISLAIGKIKPTDTTDTEIKIRRFKGREEVFREVFFSEEFSSKILAGIAALNDVTGNKVLPIWNPKNGPIGTNEAKPRFGDFHNNKRESDLTAETIADSEDFKRGVPLYAFVIIKDGEGENGPLTPTRQDIEQLSILVQQASIFRDTILMIIRTSKNNPLIDILAIKEKAKLKNSPDPRNKREATALRFSKPLSGPEAEKRLREMQEYYWVQAHTIPVASPSFTEIQMKQLLQLA